jgi:hypothetical protein
MRTFQVGFLDDIKNEYYSTTSYIHHTVPEISKTSNLPFLSN